MCMQPTATSHVQNEMQILQSITDNRLRILCYMCYMYVLLFIHMYAELLIELSIATISSAIEHFHVYVCTCGCVYVRYFLNFK